MDRPGKLFGQDGVNLALACDAALPHEAGGDNLQPEMSLFTAMGTGVMPGVKVGIVVNGQTLRFERGFQLLADLVCDGHGVGSVLP